MSISRTFLFLGFAGLIVSVLPMEASISVVSSIDTQPPDLESLANISISAQTWMNSVGPLTSFTFAGYGSNVVDLNYPSGLTVDGVTFVGSDNYLYVRQESSVYYYGSDFLYGPPQSYGYITDGNISVTLPPDVYSVGWSWGNFYDIEGMTVTFADGETFTEPGIFGFVGFTSTDPITTFEIRSPTFPVIYDQFSFVEDVPEPTYRLLLLGAVAILVAGRVWTRSRSSDAPRKTSAPLRHARWECGRSLSVCMKPSALHRLRWLTMPLPTPRRRGGGPAFEQPPSHHTFAHFAYEWRPTSHDQPPGRVKVCVKPPILK